jgi:hypothetical protein
VCRECPEHQRIRMAEPLTTNSDQSGFPALAFWVNADRCLHFRHLNGCDDPIRRFKAHSHPSGRLFSPSVRLIDAPVDAVSTAYIYLSGVLNFSSKTATSQVRPRSRHLGRRRGSCGCSADKAPDRLEDATDVIGVPIVGEF